MPRVINIGFLTNPTNLISEGDTRDMHEAARSVRQQITVLNASTAHEIDAVFARAARQRIGAFMIDVDGLFVRNADQLVALAARYRTPMIYATREYAMAGGLMSYGDDRQESIRQAGICVGRVLKGEKPANLPVLQPTKFELILNRKTAKALGIKFPNSILVRATEVIE